MIMAAVLAVMGLYLYFIEIRGTEKKKTEAEAAQRLFSFSDSDIAEITVTQGGSDIVLQSVPGHPDTPWRITRPVETVADEGIVSDFAFQIANLKSTREVEKNPSDYTVFGLEPPQSSVRVILNGANSELLSVGSKSLTGSGLYVRFGNTVYLVDGEIEPFFRKRLADWRRQELFRFFSSDVKSIRLETLDHGTNQLDSQGHTVSQMGMIVDEGNQVVEIVREGEEGAKADWLIKGPEGDEKADGSKVFGFLGDLSSLRGDLFIDENKEAKIAELGNPFFRVSISIGSTAFEGAFYKVVSEPEQVYVVTTPTAPIYKISSARFDEVNKPRSHFKVEPPDAVDNNG